MPPVPLPRWIRQRSGWPVALALVLVLATSWWFRSRTGSEPQIRGHGVSEWLAALAGRQVPGITTADLADISAVSQEMVQLGETAYPALEAALLSDSVGRRLATVAWKKLPPAIQQRIPQPLSPERLQLAAMAIIRHTPFKNRKNLGNRLAPKLLELHRRPDNAHWISLIGFIVYDLRPEAGAVMAELREFLRDPSLAVREQALFALLPYGGRNIEAALPELCATLAETNGQNAMLTIQVLVNCGPEAQAVVPILEHRLKTGWELPLVAQALWNIDRQTNTALRYLTNEIGIPHSRVARFLGTMGPAARPAVPFLVAELDNDETRIRLDSAQAIWRIAPEQIAPAVPAMLRLLTNGWDAPVTSKWSIAEASHAAYLLGEFGTNAPSARWALEFGAKCPHPPLAEACRRALQVSTPAP